MGLYLLERKRETSSDDLVTKQEARLTVRVYAFANGVEDAIDAVRRGGLFGGLVTGGVLTWGVELIEDMKEVEAERFCVALFGGVYVERVKGGLEHPLETLNECRVFVCSSLSNRESVFFRPDYAGELVVVATDFLLLTRKMLSQMHAAVSGEARLAAHGRPGDEGVFFDEKLYEAVLTCLGSNQIEDLLRGMAGAVPLVQHEMDFCHKAGGALHNHPALRALAHGALCKLAAVSARDLSKEALAYCRERAKESPVYEEALLVQGAFGVTGIINALLRRLDLLKSMSSKEGISLESHPALQLFILRIHALCDAKEETYMEECRRRLVVARARQLLARG